MYELWIVLKILDHTWLDWHCQSPIPPFDRSLSGDPFPPVKQSIYIPGRSEGMEGFLPTWNNSIPKSCWNGNHNSNLYAAFVEGAEMRLVFIVWSSIFFSVPSGRMDGRLSGVFGLVKDKKIGREIKEYSQGTDRFENKGYRRFSS